MQHPKHATLPLLILQLAGIPILGIHTVSCLAADKSLSTDTVEIVAPMEVPDLGITKEKATSNIKSVQGKEISQQNNASLNEYLNERMQSVSVNDYQGNPFQMDVSFRGFTASPLLGTPQGLSIYLDGARMNDPFGDVVNWDILPMNAIDRLDIVPGSNPLYGLNTIGGALSMKTKSGFTTHQTEFKATTGSWGRQQFQASAGGSTEHLAGFIAINDFKEDGWRDFSPTSVKQLFTKLEGQFGNVDTALSMLSADNKLVGNGLTPLSMLQQRYSAILTSPDETTNKTQHFNWTTGWQINDQHRTELMLYQRHVTRDTLNGDWNDDFEDSDFNGKKGGCGDPNAADCGSPGGQVTGAPIGLLNKTKSKQNGEGFNLHYTWDTDKNHLLIGTTLDQVDVSYQSSTKFATLDANRRVQEVELAAYPYNSTHDLVLNKLSGTSKVTSAFFSDTWSVMPTLHLTLAGRYTKAIVSNTLQSNAQRPIDAEPFTDANLRPAKSESFTYYSFNPSIGAAWNVRKDLNVFGNISRGNRVPSALELGCANPLVPCRVPSSLTDDPYLAQVISITKEIGANGQWSKNVAWNSAVFRTDLTDDILFVGSPVSNQLGYFTNFGKTRRQGLELGLNVKESAFELNTSYTYLEATYESPASLRNNANSTSRFDTQAQGNQSQRFSYQVQPGDNIPGIPNHQFKVAFNYHVTPKFDMGISMNAFSSSYVRGNENNQHEAGSVTDNNGTTRTFLNSGKVPGYAVLNFQISYKANANWSFFGKVNNIFDKEYYNGGSLVQNPFAPSGVNQGNLGVSGFNHHTGDWQRVTAYAPGAPRAAWIGAEFQF